MVKFFLNIKFFAWEKLKWPIFAKNHPKNLKIFLVTQNGPGYNKNNKKLESAMLDIHDGMHSNS